MLFIDRLALQQGFRLHRQFMNHAAAIGITGADRNVRERIKHVHFHDGQRARAVDAHGVFAHHRVIPTAAARSACGCAIFIAPCPQRVARLVKEFRRERAFADARGVGFNHA